MKSKFFALLLMLLMLLLICPIASAQQRVAVFDYDDRLDAPDTVAKYVEEKLKKILGPELLVEQFSGQEDDKITRDTLKTLDKSKYDLIITITSDALIPARHYIIQTPALFTNVNNPLFLGLNTLEASGGNMSGASYYVAVEKQLRFFQELQPGINKLGFIFDNDAQSKRIEVAEIRRACKKLEIEYELEFVSEKDELPAVVTDLIKKEVDAIVVTSSGKIYNNVNLFLDLSMQSMTPVYSFHKSGVKNGAVAALASDYYVMIDKLIVPMAYKILQEGVPPGSMPVVFLDEPFIYLNMTQADKLGISVRNDIKNKAVKTY